MRRWLPVVFVVMAACAADPIERGADPTGGVTTIASTTVATTGVATASTTTIPESAPWAVVVVGDFGTGDAVEAQVAGAIADWVGRHPETRALVTTGDNFYTADVAAAWEVPYGWVAAAGLPVWAVAGNHDLESPGQWVASERAFGSFPHWRTAEVAGVTFVLLDSNQVGSAEQGAWLERTVVALAGQPWIAVFHHPVKSCSLHGSTAEVAQHWAGMLGSARLILNGHDHNYQRFETESGWAVVTGGGGSSLHGLQPCPAATAAPVVAAVQWHFVAITGLGDHAVATAYEVLGGVIDSFLLDLAARP
jgi:hypothetical protein